MNTDRPMYIVNIFRLNEIKTICFFNKEINLLISLFSFFDPFNNGVLCTAKVLVFSVFLSNFITQEFNLKKNISQ